jgi:phosphoglucosamine mutase
MAVREQKPLSVLANAAMTRVPQILVNGTLKARKPLDQMVKTTRAIAAAEKKLGKSGRVVVRWSGTEPKLRVMVEGESEKLIRTLADDILDTAKAELGAS